MKTIDIIFDILAWLIAIFIITYLCNIFGCEEIGWVFAGICGWFFGKYLSKKFNGV